MKNFTCIIAALLLTVQFTFSQEKYSRIKITNPSQQQILTIASQGIDLSCGVNHVGEDLILELSQSEINSLENANVQFRTEIENITEFYANRAQNSNHIRSASVESEQRSNHSNMLSRSISSVIKDNIIQYSGSSEIDFVEPQNFPDVNSLAMGGCLTISQVHTELDEMYTYSQTNSLDIVSQKSDASSTGQTTWGNPSGTITNNGLTYTGQGTSRWDPQTIYYTRITGNQSTTAEGSKPQILFTSMIHSREVSALMNNIYFMWYIIENYGSDPAITELVDNNELYFVPVVNPDGLRWNEHLSPTGGGMQRKNLRPNTGGTTNTTTTRGVDLNRNFDYYWGLNNVGSSGTQTASNYRGPSPESEPETQIMVDFISSRNIKSAVWNHSYANSVPHPYGGDPNANSGREDEYYRWHEEMTRYNRYLYGATIFYESNGLPDDWMMGGAPDNNSSTGSGQGIIATTPEHGGGSDGFWPSRSRIVPIAKQSMRISLGTAYYGGKYAKLHDLTQTSINSLNADLDFGIERIGQTQSGFTVTVTPLSSNIVSITSPPTQTGIPINTTTNPSFRNQRNVSASIELDPTINANDKIEYKVQLSNDDGVIYEANYEKYYQPTILFSNTPDTDGLTGWSQSGGWSTTTSDAYSGTTSISTGTYSNNATKTLTTTNSYDFSNSAEVAIQFYAKWDLERNYDFVEVLASPDGGSSWISLSGMYTKPEATSATTSHDNKSATYANFQANSMGNIYDGDRMDNWVMEEFTIDSNYPTLLSSNNVLIRFNFRTDALNVNESYTTTNDGFFIDDFKVLSIQIPCELNVPTGLEANNLSAFTADINWDDIPSANYDLRYKETSSPTWIDITDIASSNYSLSGLNSTTEYEVQVRTKCDVSTSDYTNSVIFSTTVECSGSVVSAYPYLETFNSGLGFWTQNAGDNGDWSVNSGATASNNTGPTDDISVGGNYLYTEASTNGLGSNATVILTSPCFDLTNFNGGYFSFFYHMYGADLGTLNLEISNDDGTSWTNVFSQTGGSENLWKNQNIDLNGYAGDVVKFRFTGITGNGWSSDISIDHISVIESGTNCVSMATDTDGLLGIGRVQMNSIDNSSTAEWYSDFYEVSTTVSKSTIYGLTITPEYNTATTNAVGYAVWIDFNGDGDFNDSGEQVFTQNPITGGNPVSGNISVPSGIATITTTMRVSMKFNAVPTSCEIFTYGEVEDYTIDLFNGLLYSNSAWTPSAPSAATAAEDILILDGIYNPLIDIDVNNVTVATGAEININKANNITVNGNITNNGEFILNSDSIEFSSLIFSGTVSGDLKYNRHVNSNTNRNDLIAAPFSGEQFVDFVSNNSNIVSNNDNTLYLFGPFSKTASDYVTYSSTETNTLDPGMGYRAASTDNSTFTFTGIPTTGNFNIPISKTGSAFDIWNLIGNPYPSYIKLEDFLTANISQLDANSAAVYGYDADNTDGSYWTIWNLAYAFANPNTLIAPGQGYFVSSKDGGGTISFTPAMQSTGSSDDFVQGRNSTLKHGTILMESDTNSYSTDLYFTDNATLSLDPGYDASHFNGASDSFSVFSELAENNMGMDMAIQAIGLNDINSSVAIPLGVNIAEGEQATISMNTTNIDFDVYLQDIEENVFTLLNTNSYTFVPSTPLNGIGRFYISFQTSTLSSNEVDLDSIHIYNDRDNKQIVINGRLNSNVTITLYDIQGRAINSIHPKSDNTVNTISTTNLNSGVYIVRINGKTSSTSRKVIIN